MRKIICLMILLFVFGCAPQTEAQRRHWQQWNQQMQSFAQGLNQQSQQRKQEFERQRNEFDRQRMVDALEGIERQLRK